MSIPLRSRVHTRILLNFRVDPSAIRPLIPAGLEPVLVEGAAVAGVCFIRQVRIRPSGFPGFTGVSLEAAAHRVAVTRNGERAVLVLRRDAAGLLPKIASRMIGASFGEGTIEWDALSARLVASDGATASIREGGAERLRSSLFASRDAAADFFRQESLSIEPDGRSLTVTLPPHWSVEAIERATFTSSMLSALGAEPDSAFVARNLDALWE